MADGSLSWRRVWTILLIVNCGPLGTAVAKAGVLSLPLPAIWQVKLDPADAGVDGKWFSSELKEVGWTPISTHKWSGWDKQGMPEHVGYAWYRIRWKAPRTPRTKFVYLYFGAVDEQAWVWINGSSAGEHTAASEKADARNLWTKSFSLNVTGRVRFGKANVLAVRVHNQAAMGGVWQPVHLFASTKPLSHAQMTHYAKAMNKAILSPPAPPVRYEAWADKYAYAPVFPDSAAPGSAKNKASGGNETSKGPWARSHTKTIRLRGASGETVPLMLHVRNRGRAMLPIRIHFQDVRHAKRPGFLLNADRIGVHVVDFVRTNAKDLVPDPLPAAGGANNLHVSPNETRSYFVRIDTRGLPAGLWKGAVQLTPLRSGPRLAIPLELDIAPVVLPEEMPIWVAIWTYDPQWICEAQGRGREEAYVALMQRTGVNTTLTRSYGTPWPVLDPKTGELTGINTLDLDSMLVRRQFDSKKHFLVLGLLLEHTKSHWGGGDIRGEQWSRNFVRYVKLLSRHVRENLKIPYERWGLYLQDERIKESEGFPHFGRLTRQADPKVRIWANWVDELKHVRKAEPYIDIIVPVIWGLGKHPDSMEYLRARNKEWWIYENAGAQPPGRTAVPRNDPTSSYRKLRMHGWYAWDLDLKGVSYWLFLGKWWWRHSGFDKSARGRYANCSFIYMGHDGPVTSRRLEAWREGLEDYKLLWVLNKAAGAAGRNAAGARKAREHIAAAVKAVLAKPRKAETLLRWRNMLLDDAATLCAAAPLDVRVKPVVAAQRQVMLSLSASKPIRVWAHVRTEGVKPPMAERKWRPAAASLEPSREPTVTITGLVPGQRGQATLVIAGPEGQQRILRQDFKTQSWR